MHKEHVVLGQDAPALDARSTASVLSDAGVYGSSPQVEAAVFAAFRKSGIDAGGAGGATTTVNPDGSRTITMTSTTVDGDTTAETETRPGTDASRDPAETVRLLAELDRMRASGALGQTEFDTIKRRLLGEE